MLGKVADSPPLPLLLTPILFWLISQCIMLTKCQSLKCRYGGGIDIPDTWWFGFGADNSDDTLYNYLDRLGPQGRRAYTEINLLDFIIYIPSYTLLLWALLFRQCRYAGISTSILPWICCMVVVVCDVIESLLFGYATRQFPNRLDSYLLLITSIANQGKWISLLLGLLTLVALSVRNNFVGGGKSHQC